MLFFTLIQMQFAKAVFSQQGWFIQQSSFQYPTGDVFFIDSQTGWITSDSGRVFKSTDGGWNWILYTAGTDYTLYSIRFINAQTGWAAGGLEYYNPFSMEYAVIVKTTNGGVNWMTQFNDSWGPHFNTLSILDINTVYAIGEGTDMSGFASNGICLKTTNSGVNWIYDTLSGKALVSMNFINSQTGWIYGYSSNDVLPAKRFIFRTTNGGTSWTNTYLDSLHSTFSVFYPRIFFGDANTGYFLDNVPRKSVNGGFNWVFMDSLSTYGSRNLFFTSKDTGWICGNAFGNNFIRRTTNGGINWTNQYTPAYADRMYFINSNTGWGINPGRQLIKTTTGGVSPNWDTASVKYNPMLVGNKYIYNYISTPYGTESYYTRSDITKDTLIGGTKYFYYQNSPLFGNNWIRFDSLNGMLLARSTNSGCGIYPNDNYVDSLASRVNNHCDGCFFTWFNSRICMDTVNVTLFGTDVFRGKNFRHDGMLLGSAVYARNIGVASVSTTEAGTGGYWVLKGCQVNGSVYGDTNMYYSVSGTVRYTDNNQIVTSGMVKAIKHNKLTGQITFVDSANVQSDGTYRLIHLRQDSVYIGLYPVTTPPRDYLISYYPSTNYWETASIIYPTNNLSNINLGAIRITETTALNSVSGKVMSNLLPKDANLCFVNLYAKSGDEYVRCTSTDINGIYRLNSLPIGTLRIIANRIGYKSDSTNVTVTYSGDFDSVNFYLNLWTMGISKSSGTPDKFSLGQNYPNPFNPATNIKFDLPANGFVNLKIFNLLGQEITTLVNQNMNAGSYTVDWNASAYPSGVYFCRIAVTDASGKKISFNETKRMVLLK